MAVTLVVAETVAICILKHIAPMNAFGVVYLLGVLIVSTQWGFGLALATSLGSAIAFDYFRNWPYGHYMPFQAQNEVVVAIFLVVALLANSLAGLARARAVEADHRRREAEESRDKLSALARQQAALRRVATLVACGVNPPELFTAVASEIGRCLDVDETAIVRYESDGTTTTLATYREPGTTGDASSSSEGDRCAAPIIVAGRVWGAAVAGSSRDVPLPVDAEVRIGDFADLVATAIVNAATRAELAASRARIVAAADDARRRLERDLHDGAQQRLVSVGLKLRIAEAAVPDDLAGLKTQLSDLVDGVSSISEGLQEVSRGIHPAILARGGLGPALKTLARNSVLPCVVDVGLDRPVPEPIAVTAYYVVAEALTNAAKHARASEVHVSVDADQSNLKLSIQDDGVGGANPRRGSGLIGLIDRVEAAGGRLYVTSPAGGGTSLHATIPFSACSRS